MAWLLSLIIGFIALILAIPAILPVIGLANWLIVPFALMGAFIGQFSSGKGPRNFCIAVAAFCMLRLWVGGGLL